MKIVLFGAGAEFKKGLELTRSKYGDGEIIAVVDNSKDGENVEGYIVEKPEEELLKKADMVIVTTNIFFDEISIQLDKSGIKNVYVIYKNEILSELCFYRKYFEYRRKEQHQLLDRIKKVGALTTDMISKDARLYLNREQALYAYGKGLVCAEVGVAYGNFSEKILDIMNPSYFYAVDYFSQEQEYRVCGYEKFKDANCSHEEYYRNCFKKYIDDGKMEVKQGLSWDALTEIGDDSLDFVYLDADHSFDSVTKDVNVLYKKVKSGGIIQFNDYTGYFIQSNAFVGTKPAVFNFLKEGKGEIIGYCLQEYGCDDIIVKIKK